MVIEARQEFRAGTMDADQLQVMEDERTDAGMRLVEAELDCALEHLAAFRAATGTLDAQSPMDDVRSALLLRSVEVQ